MRRPEKPLPTIAMSKLDATKAIVAQRGRAGLMGQMAA
jgi:hypothetical protein